MTDPAVERAERTRARRRHRMRAGLALAPAAAALALAILPLSSRLSIAFAAGALVQLLACAYLVPFLGHRGTPVGVDVMKVLDTGVVPVIDGGLAGRDGVGQIGAGILKAPIECFAAARDAYVERYGVPAPAG